jgi:hypothetical protein
MGGWGDEGDEGDEKQNVGNHRKSFPLSPCPLLYARLNGRVWFIWFEA